MGKTEEMLEKKSSSVYEAPLLRILVFTGEDVLTASTDVGGEWPGDWGQ